MRKIFRAISVGVVAIASLCSFADKKTEVVEQYAISRWGDTSAFVPNKDGKWGVLFSYLNQDTPDSVQLELILTLNGDSFGGTDERYIGSISNQIYLPASQQKATYYLLPDNRWEIRIAKTGECYLKQITGNGIAKSDLAGSPYVLPVKVRFRIK